MNTQLVVDRIMTSLARMEEHVHTDATILPNFPRSIQLDYYSCGAKSAYMVLKYFGKRCTHKSVERRLGTTIEGTSRADIVRVLRKNRLKVQVNTDISINDLKKAINAGSPVLVSLYDNWHYSVVYGISDTHVFVMNPSLGEMGSIKVAVNKSEWRKIFDLWGLIISR